MQPIPNDAEQPAFDYEDRLALHVRRHRTWYRDRQLEQAELAALAGLSGRQVRSYERCQRLPAAVGSLLAMAIVLEVKMEDLVAPHVVARLTREVEARRAAFHGPALSPSSK